MRVSPNRREVPGEKMPCNRCWIQRYRIGIPGDRYQATHPRRQLPGDLRVDAGGYSQLVWNLNKTWEMGARYGFVTGSPEDDLVPEATDDRHRVSGQVTYRPSHFSRLRLQGSVDNPLYRPEPIYVGMLAIEFLVGAHGAHQY